MDWNDDTQKVFDQLLAELVDEDMSDERRVELGEMVGCHPEARELYIDFCQLQAQLLEQNGALGESGKRPSVKPVTEPKQFPKAAWLALAAAVVIVIGLAVNRGGDGGTVDNTPVATLPDRGDVVATVVNGAGMSFAYGVDGGPVLLGDDFRSGAYELKQGVMELTTTKDVQLLLQAPASFTFDAAGDVELENGRLSARVPASAIGFTVTVGKTEVVDLGTQFVVDASQPEFCEVHVFEGKVLVRSPMSDGQGTELATGNALRVYRDTGLPAGIDLENDRYLRDLNRTESAYAELVLSMKPVLYYPMTASLDGATLLDASANEIHGVISGMDTGSAQWTKGRVGTALYLAGPSGKDGYARVEDYPKASGNQISCSAWVYAESRPTGKRWATILKNWGLSQKGQFHFGLMPGGLLEAHVNDVDDVQKFAKEETPFPINQWQHVAFVADGSQLRLYRNGEQVASASYTAISGDPELKGLGLGVKPDSDDPESIKRSYWNGRLDEVALFNRALSDQEIRQLFEAAKPNK